MRRKELLCLVVTSVALQLCDLIAGDAVPTILGNSPDLGQLRSFQSRVQPDPRPRLSTTQQQQILSDVQQHQRRYNLPNQEASSSSQLVSFPGLSRQSSPKSEFIEQTSFPSLAKYRVDRNKQQLLQQQQQQLQQQQQQLQQQQQQKTEALSFLQTAQSQRYQPQYRQQQQQQQQQQQFQSTLNNQQFGNFQLTQNGQNIYDDDKLQLSEYYEKQRQLELLKKQREQLILEQQEIKRQQELLRLQHLASLTSTPKPSPSTTTTQATTSRSVSYVTTSSPILLSSPASRRITPAESDLFLKAIATHQKKFTGTSNKSTTTTTTATTARPTRVETETTESKLREERLQDFGNNAEEIPKDLLSLIQAQQPQLLASGKNKPQIKIIYQTEKSNVAGQSNQAKTKSSQYSSTSSTSSSSASERDTLLKQLKLALAQSNDDGNKNVTTRDLVLPNGKKLQVIQAPNGLSSIVPNDGASQFQTVTQALESSASTVASTTTIKPAKAILEELTKGVLPPGADFEVLRHKDDGKLEEVGKSPIHSQPGKKVTFVVLEEQPDGSYKVQGVKGNSGKDNGADVQSIVDRIKKGEIKLPPRSSASGKNEASPKVEVARISETTTMKSHENSDSSGETKIDPTTFRPTSKYSNSGTTGHRDSSSSSEYFPYVTVSPNSVSQTDNYVTSASTKSSHIYNSLVNFSTTQRNPSSRYEEPESSSRFTTTISPSSNYDSSEDFSRFTSPTPSSSRYEVPSRYTTAGQSSSRYETSQKLARFPTSNNPSSRYENSQENVRFTTPNYQSSRYEDNNQGSSSRYQNPSTSSSSYDDSHEFSRFTSPSSNPSSRYEENPTFATSGLPRTSLSSSPSPINQIFTTTSSPAFSSTTTFSPQTSSYVHFTSKPPVTTRTSASTYNGQASENLVLDDFNGRVTVPSFLESTQNTIPIQETMTNLMRREGLFAMAKYLRQSGLDTVLNETGPYTIFVPTDKAFRTLLVQLGGPEKAEQKFRENPRLLSGLLLHHVIPGAFRIDSLQDEMTGVSLAGTQLRVNVYDMHDQEWNDVKVTTINGAKVAPNKRDIEIPQGIAHAIDRVMFPLPVGDLTQTLQADRERRFGTFLKILHASGLEETLAGTKTFTVFAPTDSAFANAASINGRPVWSESDGSEAAKDIITRHVIPTTLYTGGMRYYHQRDTLRPQVSLSIHKNGGRVRVNEAHVVTHNVPATNGVIHAIDGVL